MADNDIHEPDAAALTSDSDDSDGEPGPDDLDEPLSGDDDIEIPQLEEVVETEPMERDEAEFVEVEREKKKPEEKPQKSKIELSKKAQNICSVPGCQSKYLVSLGVQLSSFLVPQPSQKNLEIWLKWIHALGLSSTDELSESCNSWARVCELHFTENSFQKDFTAHLEGRKSRTHKKLKLGSYPTLNVAVPEAVLEDPRLVFHTDPIAKDDLEPTTIDEKKRLRAKILAEAEVKVRERLALYGAGRRTSVLPSSLTQSRKDEYDKRVRDLITSSGIQAPPSFIDDLYRKLGVPKAPKVVPESPKQLPPCTILRPVAKEGEPPLPAILLPGMNNEEAVKLLQDPNIQEMLKTMAEKHKEDMAKKMAEEGDEEEEEYVNEEGDKCVRMKKKEVPPPPMIILQTSDKDKAQVSTDIVQEAINKTFNQAAAAATSQSQRSVAGQKRKLPHQQFLESLPPLESRYILNDDGNIVAAPSGDHDYHGQVSDLNGIPIFDPTGLRQEIDFWRLEVETLRRKNFELRMKLSELRYNKRVASSSKSGYRSIEAERKKMEKLETYNQKLQEELVKLKLERRRMMNKERNRKRKRQKVLERRQKRRDWIMEQIALGKMTKEHLELVYSRKKLPYEKKSSATDVNSDQQVTVITVPSTSEAEVSHQHQTNLATGRQRRPKQVKTHETVDDLSGMTSVVVSGADVQHHEMSDENIVAVAGIPGVVISSDGGTHQIIVEGGAEEYTSDQIDFIVKAVDDMTSNGWKVASPRQYQRQQY